MEVPFLSSDTLPQHGVPAQRWLSAAGPAPLVSPAVAMPEETLELPFSILSSETGLLGIQGFNYNLKQL